jgi:hypothetical protein
MVRIARGWFLYTRGYDTGGVYKTVYQETIPKMAKLTTRGNSQVLALQGQLSNSLSLNYISKGSAQHSAPSVSLNLTPRWDMVFPFVCFL